MREFVNQHIVMSLTIPQTGELKKRKGLVAIVKTSQPVAVDYWQTKCAPQA